MDHLTILGREDIAHGKALQLYIDREPFLIISNGTDYHQDILKKFLSENEIHSSSL